MQKPAPKPAAADTDTHSEPDGPQANLDSGYAWLILLVMFLLQASIGGASRVYGMIYAREVQLGYYDREQASWPIATASAVENLAGILSPALVRRLSWRKIELIGTSLLVLANGLAYASDSLALDVMALGLVQGLALSSCTVLSLLINNDYFERHRTTAYGVSMCGSTFGLLYLSPLATWILESYDDFRLVYLALAGSFAVNTLLVLFIVPRAEAPALGRLRFWGGRPAGEPAAPQTPAQGHRQSVARKRSRLEASRRESVASISYMARSRRNSVLSRAGLAGGEQAARRPHAQLAKSKSGADLAGRLAGQKLANEALMKKISLCSIKAPVLARAAPALARSPSVLTHSSWDSLICRLSSGSKVALDASDLELELVVAKLDKCVEAAAAAPEAADADDRSRPGPETEGPPDGLIGLLRLPYLHCTWIMLALYYLIARIFVIILVDFAHDRGLDSLQSISLLNYWSFGELLGRLLLGSLIDLRLLSCRSCIALTCGLIGGLIGCMVLSASYLVYALCSLLVAALVSLEYMLINVMMVEYVGKRLVTNCYSLAACVASAVLFGRPSMIGFFRDRLGSYDGLLLTLAGMAGAFGALFYLLEPLMVRRWPKSGPAAATAAARTTATAGDSRRPNMDPAA